MKKITLTLVALTFLIGTSLSAQAALACKGGASGSHSKSNTCSYSQGATKQSLADTFFWKHSWVMDSKDAISLTEAQSSALKQLKTDFKKDLIMKEANIEVLAIDIKKGLYENPIDVKTVNGLIDQKYDYKKAKTKSSVEAIAKLKKIVTDDQWETLKSQKH